MRFQQENRVGRHQTQIGPQGGTGVVHELVNREGPAQFMDDGADGFEGGQQHGGRDHASAGPQQAGAGQEDWGRGAAAEEDMRGSDGAGFGALRIVRPGRGCLGRFPHAVVQEIFEGRLGHLDQPCAGPGDVVPDLRRPPPFDAVRSTPLTVLSAVGLVLRILLGDASQRIGTLQIGSPDPRLIGGAPYLLALDPEGRDSLVMRPRRILFLKLMLRALWVSACYAVTRRRAAEGWRKSLPFLRSRARWRREFAQGRD